MPLRLVWAKNELRKSHSKIPYKIFRKNYFAMHYTVQFFKNGGQDGWGGHWLVQMEWRPAGWSVCLPLLIFPCTIVHKFSGTGSPRWSRKRTIKRLCVSTQYKYHYMSASTTEYKNFFPKTIKEWNNCSADLIESSFLDIFKDSLVQCSCHSLLYCAVAGTHQCDTPLEVCRLSRQDKAIYYARNDWK